MTLNLATRVVSKTRDWMTADADICVVGSGAAGIMAALTAASLGHKTILVDAMPTIGGQLVGTLLGTICGLYSNGERPYRLTYGPVDDLLNDLALDNAIHPRRALDTIVLQYDEARSGRWAEQALTKSGVIPLLGTVLRDVRMDDRRVAELDLATRWGDVRLRARGFVDASGDATLAWHAGLSVREPECPQWGTQMILIEGFDEATTAQFDGFQVERALKERGQEFGLPREDGFIFAFPGRGIATANLTHVETPTEPFGAARATLEGRDQADRLLKFLKAEFPAAMKNARIRAYGQTGIRQTRWIVGAHHLTMEEVRAAERPDDAVARCAWPVEAHDKAETVHWEKFSDRNHMHHVPFGSLVPQDADNLVAAGRCIDGDVGALASVRVMGPCFAMGQAAAHALNLAGSESVHQIDIARLQDRLRDNLETNRTDPWCEGI